MKVEITRTSEWGDKQPCEEARREAAIRIDQRTFKTPDEHDKRLACHEKWLSQGFDHGVNETGIFRKFHSEAWVIDVESLDDLLALARKYKCELCISTSGMWSEYPRVELYDDYRE